MTDIKAHAGKFNAVAGIAALVLAAAIIIVLVIALKGGSTSHLEPFPTTDYLQSPQNFLGNSYRIDAQVESMLSYRPGVGRLLVVKTDGRPVPVFLPEGLADSIHTGQRYNLGVSVQDGGLIYINELEKY
ncbi:hypothetical protein [Cerasicoccus arenae]|nr:hypothetical protein [Cerasicoccus arenae]MBK1858347.1 hypothetical protein [Cerasicoccus arenae]